MRYAIVTFGCRVNQADSLCLEAQLRAGGATPAQPDDADVVIVNTCSVTATADQGARQAIRRVSRDNPSARIVVTGCYATRRPDEIAVLPNVVRVVPNDRKEALGSELALEWRHRPGPETADVRTTAERYGAGDGACGALQPGVAGRTALTLRVQTGCDEACTYCIIPRTRGSGRSRALRSVLADIRRAVDAGYKEIVLTGVHLGSYGRDLGDGTTLEALIRALAEWPDDVLFRISSLEPMDCSAEIIDLVAASRRLAPHFHLPLQHACDDLLRAMGRPYTSSFYRGLIERIAARIPDAAIGSDVIVGFPGERGDHVEFLLSFLRGIPFSHLHVFPYSDRPDTVASRLAAKVPGQEIRARAAAVREAGHDVARVFQAAQVGSVRRGLTVEDGSHVVTDNHLKLPLDVRVPRNEWVLVRVSGEPGRLAGTVLERR